MKTDAIELPISATETIFMPYILTGSELVLVDAGYPGMTEQIEHGLFEKGLCLGDVTQIWITHHDHDHVGSLAEIKRRYPKIIVRASRPETACIEGTQTGLRLRQAMEQQDSLPEEAQQGGLDFQAYLKTIVPCKVDEALIPGRSQLDEAIQVLDTPGHTDGHISFYDPTGQTLIAGDLVVKDSEALSLPFPQYAFDLKQAQKSVMAVTELPIRRVICYHGGIVTGSAEEIKTMLQEASKQPN